MPHIRFTGRTLPSALELTHVTGAKLRWLLDEAGTIADFEIKIERGIITIDCECSCELTEELIVAIYIRSSDMARATVDIIAFSTGIGFMVILDKRIMPDGSESEIMPEDRSVASLCTAYGLDVSRRSDFSDVYRTVLSDPAIFMALHDLIESISNQHAAPVNCARAIEGIRHLIAPGLDAKKGWIVLDNALRCNQTYTDLIISNSFQQRHGNRVPVSAPIVREIVQRSWVLMNRFLEYKKRGAAPLPQPEFPTLK